MEEDLDYKDIQHEILITTNKLNSIVFEDYFNYTALPEVEEIIKRIDETINKLTQIKSKITEI